jgi:RES domain
MATLEPKRVVAPEPPVRLAEIDLPLTEVPATWFRFSAQRYQSPIFWSRKGRYRFDSSDARWGVCYVASSIVAAFQEVFGDKIRHIAPLDWTEIKEISVWRIRIPIGFRSFELFGESLSVIRATLQCFVSSYPKSQRWVAALMSHPADIDGLVYLGRRCGAPCLAMFGDADCPRAYQNDLEITRLGHLSAWDELWPMLDRLGVRLSSMPAALKRERLWSLASI